MDLQASSPWTPSLDTQWQQQQANHHILDNGQSHQQIGPSPATNPGHNQQVSSSSSSSPHNVFRAPYLGYYTSELWQRRLNVKNTTSASKPSASSDNSRIESQSAAAYANNESMMSAMGNGIGLANVNGWSVDLNLCSTQQSNSNWDSMMSSPQAFNPSVLQQPPHWMQRDRVHSQQSNQEMTSPQTTSSGDISQPPSLINSSGLSLRTEPSPKYDPSPRIKTERADDDSDQEDDQVSHVSKHCRSEKVPQKDGYKNEASYATLSKSSGLVSLPGSKRNLSKVVITKSRTLDGSSHSADLISESKETRHLCPYPGCDKHFSTSGHARRHSRIHAALRPFECPHVDCDATFTRRDNCSQHQKSRHRSQLTAHRLQKDQ